MRGRTIATSLGGQWRSGRAVVKCPAHDDRTPSLSVTETRDGRPLVHCHAGCSQAQVIDALRARGLWEGEAKVDPSYPGRLTTKHDGIRCGDDRERRQYARDLWDRGRDIKGTLAEAYLKSRGINAGSYPSLRYVPELRHAPSNKSFPAMIASLTDNLGTISAVQRTWLAPDGSGKAQVSPNKMTVGPMGNSAVKFGSPANMLGLAEGIETALSARQIYHIPVWATLSANRLAQIKLPDSVAEIVIFADHGEVGMREAFAAAEHYEGDGLSVDVMPPRVHFGDGVGDFNDAVRAS